MLQHGLREIHSNQILQLSNSNKTQTTIVQTYWNH